MNTLQGQVGTLQNQVGTLQSQMGTVQTQISVLPNQVVGLTSDVGTLQGQVASLTTRVAALEPHLTAIVVAMPIGYDATTPLSDAFISCQCVAFPPLRVTGTLSNGTTQDLAGSVVWSTSNASVATVDSSGTVLLVGRGTTTITATKDGITGTIVITLT